MKFLKFILAIRNFSNLKTAHLLPTTPSLKKIFNIFEYFAVIEVHFVFGASASPVSTQQSILLEALLLECMLTSQSLDFLRIYFDPSFSLTFFPFPFFSISSFVAFFPGKEEILSGKSS